MTMIVCVVIVKRIRQLETVAIMNVEIVVMKVIVNGMGGIE
jgi:hypothetical protein